MGILAVRSLCFRWLAMVLGDEIDLVVVPAIVAPAFFAIDVASSAEEVSFVL